MLNEYEKELVKEILTEANKIIKKVPDAHSVVRIGKLAEKLLDEPEPPEIPVDYPF